MKIMFLDESGDHNLKKISSIHPVFVLGGVIVDRAYARTVIEPAMQTFKARHFGRTDLVLHTVEMNRGRGAYAFLADPVKRALFYSELNDMLASFDYKVVACVIKKDDHIRQYGANAADPYHYSLEILVERFCMELGPLLDSGFICAECRNPGLDKRLMEAWDELRANGLGTGFMSSSAIDERIVGLDLKDKRPNLAGLQLADLVITPIGRHVAGIPMKSNEVQRSVVETKLRTHKGSYVGSGLNVRP